MTRRQLVNLIAASLIPSFLLAKPENKTLQSDLKLNLKPSDFVDPGDPVATSLKYSEDSKKRKDFEGNTCESCKYFSRKGVYDGTVVGTCVVFQDKFVNRNSHCISWTQKNL